MEAAGPVSQVHGCAERPKCPDMLPHVRLAARPCCSHALLSPCCPERALLPPTPHSRRSTTKFWVAPADVPRLRAAIVRHLPLLVYGRPEGALMAEVEVALAAWPAQALELQVGRGMWAH